MQRLARSATIVTTCTIVAGLAACVQAQSQPNPYTTADDIESGRLLVRGICSACHGVDGSGGRGPDLTAETLRHGNSPQAIFRNIQQGIAGTGMKGAPLPDKMIWQIVSFLRENKATSLPDSLDGDPAMGKRLYEKLNCASCHGTASRPGRRGSDLSRATSTVDHVRLSIVDPNKDIDDRYSQVMLVLFDGRVLPGMLLNENGYYVQYMDDQETLHTVAKRDIEVFSRSKQSHMPDYRNQLSPDQLSDLINYVFSLRKP